MPCLKAGGAEVLIDRERFEAGKSVVGQMDTTQDAADRHLLVLTEEYLGSAYCVHEMERAVARDPGFNDGCVVPVLRGACALPDLIGRPDPLVMDLQKERDPDAWSLALKQCDADLGTTAPEWPSARDRVRRFLERGQSVNLVVDGGVVWRPLLDELGRRHFPGLVRVDLERGSAESRRGLLTQILSGMGHRVNLPPPPEDLVEFDRLVFSGPPVTLALAHFDRVVERGEEYGLGFFSALRNLIMDERRLVLLAQSRAPFAALLPSNHPLSPIDLKTVKLRSCS